MHPFISTMANMLVIFGLVTYATKGVSFGAIEPTIPNMVIPKVNGFPTIILWAVAAIVIVWFIWNKTTFGKIFMQSEEIRRQQQFQVSLYLQ